MASVSIRKAVLDDIASRFLINAPEDDKDDVMKLCDHLELAHWFYLDFLRPEDPSLPGCTFKEFMTTMFRHCPFLDPTDATHNVEKLASQWKTHKYKKPVRGAILLNNDLTKCLLVQGYPASTSWGFPKGKMNDGEKDTDAAVREVYEEVGLDTRELICEDYYIEVMQNEQSARMYIICGISEAWNFSPRARKEIKDIQWFTINDLPCHRKDTVSRINLKLSPNKFFLVMPFMSKLKKWISQAKSSNKIVTELLSSQNVTCGFKPYELYYSQLQSSSTWRSFHFRKKSILNAYTRTNN